MTTNLFETGNFNWEEMTKKVNSMTEQNLELMSRVWEGAAKNSQDLINTNLNMYFDHLNNSLDNLHNYWKQTAGTQSRARDIYRQQLETLQNQMTAVYKDTCQTFNPNQQSR